MELLAEAVGSGKGMSRYGERRVHASKYAGKKVTDPWTATVARAENSTTPVPASSVQDVFRSGRSYSRRHPFSLSYDITQMDGRDPATFGFVNIGTVVGAHGVRGMLRVDAPSDPANEFRLCEPGLRHLRLATRRSPRPVVMEGGRRLKCLGAKTRFVVELGGLDDRDVASSLAGSQLYVREDQDRPQPVFEDGAVADEFFDAHVVDLETDDVVGTVFDVLDPTDEARAGLAHPLLELDLHKVPDHHCYVPLAPPIVEAFDPDLGVIYIRPPAGLLDITFEYVPPPDIIRGFLLPASEHLPANFLDLESSPDAVGWSPAVAAFSDGDYCD
ncbi:hypothetical protein CTAYLR_000278 [Chrysophaeum taylorii]|uniref:RimM N-terminal domain-containing protein n=1 Tax=Chrysophaeum taylorii TaxID=2483200 RepID=A0AAD7UFA7_9STRA|nr:hypothetical protein CTAYLR_000278 [Chrysophaeum taylorii]